MSQGHKSLRDINISGTQKSQGHKSLRDTKVSGTQKSQGHKSLRDTKVSGTQKSQGHKGRIDTKHKQWSDKMNPFSILIFAKFLLMDTKKGTSTKQNIKQPLCQIIKFRNFYLRVKKQDAMILSNSATYFMICPGYTTRRWVVFASQNKNKTQHKQWTDKRILFYLFSMKNSCKEK